MVNALLDAVAHMPAQCTGKEQLVDLLLDQGNIDAAELTSLSMNPDHSPFVVATSDKRLVYYIAGYVSRKCILKAGCEIRLKIPLIEQEASRNVTIATFPHMRGYGGLLYPSGHLFRLVQELERLFTTCFSLVEVHAGSILDVIALGNLALDNLDVRSTVSSCLQKSLHFMSQLACTFSQGPSTKTMIRNVRLQSTCTSN